MDEGGVEQWMRCGAVDEVGVGVPTSSATLVKTSWSSQSARSGAWQ